MWGKVMCRKSSRTLHEFWLVTCREQVSSGDLLINVVHYVRGRRLKRPVAC